MEKELWIKLVKKFIKNTTMTSTRPSVAFTAQVPSKLGLKIGQTKSQGLTPVSQTIRLNNRAVPLNPKAPLNAPRAGNFGTKRLKGF